MKSRKGLPNQQHGSSMGLDYSPFTQQFRIWAKTLAMETNSDFERREKKNSPTEKTRWLGEGRWSQISFLSSISRSIWGILEDGGKIPLFFFLWADHTQEMGKGWRERERVLQNRPWDSFNIVSAVQKRY